MSTAETPASEIVNGPQRQGESASPVQTPITHSSQTSWLQRGSEAVDATPFGHCKSPSQSPAANEHTHYMRSATAGSIAAPAESVDSDGADMSVTSLVPSGTETALDNTTGSHGQVCSNCGISQTPLWRRSPTGATICNACGLYLKARNVPRPANLKKAPSLVSTSSNQAEESMFCNRQNTPPSGSADAVATREAPGTCPGGGSCNGTGGARGCDGCPAYNNRIARNASLTLARRQRAAAVALTHDGSPEPINVALLERRAQDAAGMVIACQNCRATVTPLWRRDGDGHTICNACGLYYKMHGVHRPVTMKKTLIKRRKRLVPSTTMEAHGQPPATGDDGDVSRAQQPQSAYERGFVNSDGSISLRRGPRAEEKSSGSSQLANGLDIGPPFPMPSVQGPVPHRRDMSYSPPASSQSPIWPPTTTQLSRKRSLSSAEPDTDDGRSNDSSGPEETSKRISTLRMILNPTTSDPGPTEGRAQRDSKLPRYIQPAVRSSPPPPTTYSTLANLARDGIETLERRVALKRQIEEMRRVLAANERELAQLEA